MAMKRLSMRQIRQVLRLRLEHGLATRAIARAWSVGLGTVTEYLARAREGGLGWPLPEQLDDGALEALLYPRGPDSPGPRPLPDFAAIHKELRRAGVTLLPLPSPPPPPASDKTNPRGSPLNRAGAKEGATHGHPR